MLDVQKLGAWQTYRFQLPDGDAGVADTIAYIRQLVDEGLVDPRIRRVATEILRGAGIAPYDELGEVRAVFEWVKNWRNIRFTKDMVGKEMLQPAWSILESGAGDCDCINAILLPSLLGAIGYPTRAVTIAADDSDPNNFSHIFIEALVDTGYNGTQWIPLDVARPGAAWGRVPESFYRLKRWPLMEAAEVPDESMTGFVGATRRVAPTPYLNGLGATRSVAPTGYRGRTVRRVMPRFGMGQDDGDDSGFNWTSFSQSLTPILNAVPKIETGVSQIIAAANQPNVSRAGSAISPTTSPAAAAVTVSAGGNSMGTILLLALGGLALFKIAR